MTLYDADVIRRYYDAFGDREWERFERTPVEEVKLGVHLYYLRKHVLCGHP